jgi:hypothetical protein
MSKAMDALKALEDRIIPFRLIEKGSPGADAISTIRDYITTTEAELEVPEGVEALVGKLREHTTWGESNEHDMGPALDGPEAVSLLAVFIAKREVASAARIKELEEALACKT